MERDVSLGTIACYVLAAMMVVGLAGADRSVVNSLLFLAFRAGLTLVGAIGITSAAFALWMAVDIRNHYRKEARVITENRRH